MLHLSRFPDILLKATSLLLSNQSSLSNNQNLPCHTERNMATDTFKQNFDFTHYSICHRNGVFYTKYICQETKREKRVK